MTRSRRTRPNGAMLRGRRDSRVAEVPTVSPVRAAGPEAAATAPGEGQPEDPTEAVIRRMIEAAYT